MKPSRLPFSFLLPLLNLTIWVLLVLVPTTLFYLSVRASLQHAGNSFNSANRGTYTIQRPAAPRIAAQRTEMEVAHVLTALNIPGLASEILISLPISWPDSWHPLFLPLDIWRAVTFPLFCLPAWWFVGRGFDALWRREKVNAWATSIATLLSIGFLVLCVGLTITQFAMERDGTIQQSDRLWWPIVGMGLWAFLFAGLPLAWLRERRIRTSA